MRQAVQATCSCAARSHAPACTACAVHAASQSADYLEDATNKVSQHRSKHRALGTQAAQHNTPLTAANLLYPQPIPLLNSRF